MEHVSFWFSINITFFKWRGQFSSTLTEGGDRYTGHQCAGLFGDCLFSKVSGRFLHKDTAGDYPCSSDPISFVEPAVDMHTWHPCPFYGKFLGLSECGVRFLKANCGRAYACVWGVFSSHHLVDGRTAPSSCHLPLWRHSVGPGLEGSSGMGGVRTCLLAYRGIDVPLFIQEFCFYILNSQTSLENDLEHVVHTRTHGHTRVPWPDPKPTESECPGTDIHILHVTGMLKITALGTVTLYYAAAFNLLVFF